MGRALWPPPQLCYTYPMFRFFKYLILIAIIGYGIIHFTITPSLERDWSPDQALPARAVITDDTVTIENVRNFRYRSTTDYDIDYYDITLSLGEIRTVDYIVEPFGSVGAAHTFLSFGFLNGEQIAISVEIRKERGETFSPWRGIMRQYELMYVIADERDVIDLRANHRQHDVYLYPTKATPDQARALFVAMLNRNNKLMTEPEFYHTLFSNCTTNIVDHLRAEFDVSISRFDHRLIMPAKSDELAHELGLIAPEYTLDQARAKFLINEAAAKWQGDPDFSLRIRSHFWPQVPVDIDPAQIPSLVL